MTRDRLADLAQLAGILKDRSLADLAAAHRAQQEITDQIDQIHLQISTRARAMDAMETPDAATMTGADITWRARADQTILSLRAEELQARIASDAARARAARDLGRAEVLDKLSRGKKR